MPTLEEDGWQLDDVEVLNSQYPDTFHIPPVSARKSLLVGDFAKLVFLVRDEDDIIQGERMWCKITAVTPDGYVGVLDNDPICTGLLTCGRTVEFGPNHVANILRESRSPERSN